MKPFVHEQSDEQHSTVDYIGENGNIMIVNRQKQGKEARKMFTFNKVFGGNTSQGKLIYKFVYKFHNLNLIYFQLICRANIFRYPTID